MASVTPLTADVVPLTTAAAQCPAQKWPPRIGLGSAGMRLTEEEFDAIDDYDEEYHYELIDGVLIVNPVPGDGHADPNDELGYLLRKYKDEHPQGKALDRALPERYIRMTNKRRLADRVCWTGLGRKPSTKRDLPTIVIEFVSKSRRDWTRDYVEKRDEYRAVGIQEYWIFDRFRRRFTVFKLSPDKYDEITLDENTPHTTPLLPGFSIAYSQLLGAAGDWDDDE